MLKQTIQIFGRVKPTKKKTALQVTTSSKMVYSVNNEEPTGANLEFVVPKDEADGIVNNKKECYMFRFKRVFDQAVKQEEIFENIAKPVADSVLAGYNGTIFAYGQTGSGKTFTITGGAEHYSDRGIIPRTLSYLYERFSQDSSMVYTIHISYLEIYNETGYDLLDSRHEASRLEDLPAHVEGSDSRVITNPYVEVKEFLYEQEPIIIYLFKKVIIMEDSDQNIHLRNLSMQQSANEEEALNLLFLGDTNRMIAETPMNQASTRSHCIFTLHICRRDPGSAILRRSKLHLVDLAGSDRVSKTRLNGHLLTEAKYINLSLHYLEQVIIALSEKNRFHVPFRNSTLTSVLRDSLGGNCMTSMIATIAVDKRNIDESISTCRFAQRVALIKNEAVLNEEVDPTLIIARLKRENQLLKEELTLVTGEQKEDQLAVEEIQKLEELIKAFLSDPDPEIRLSLGPDMRKIQYCFFLLKRMVLAKQEEGKRHRDGHYSAATAVQKEGLQSAQHNAGEVTRLREMLTQRDNEISILVKMLKREKKRVNDAGQLVDITEGQRLASKNGSTKPMLGEGSTDTHSADRDTRAVQYLKKGPQLSLGKQEAFDMFIRDNEAHVSIENNKSLLKQRSVDAKRLGEQLNEARNRITELKKQLVLRRKRRAVHVAVMGNEFEEEVDSVEENLRKQIEHEKKMYNSIIGQLKSLKMEIEHLQLLLEKAKVKLQKDFHNWWSQETTGMQESVSEATGRCLTELERETLQPASPSTPGYGTVSNYPSWGDPSSDPSPSFVQDVRALSATKLTSSSIPLTGDQQADADILAFINARQNLLKRTGSAKLK
ncbi:kinesin-like protein KIF6 isoform X2 [Betta splendens]|uniref:Kinesin-like protein KIF6 isoform X2 n=1 Tax=Betta splendens TaxID=158456 RepID=A0A9W2XIM3_BETSP|nr:kinesin-like protein KIF6 isoform X2 [Betta splendens]